MNLTKIITAATLIFSLQTLAEGNKGEMLTKAKAMATENIEAKIGLLNELKSCINSANDRSALKACRKQAKSKRQAHKEASKTKREQFREKRKQMKEERKKNRG